MHPIHTHYDNLQLTQNASDAEIRQAYRRLSKKYHPDLSNDPDAHRIMQIVNRAYEVLSNPTTRAEHDKWIALQYLQKQQVAYYAQPITYYSDDDTDQNNDDDEDDSPPPSSRYHHNPHQPSHSQKRVLQGLLLISAALLGLILWQGWGWLERSQLLYMITGKTPPAPVIVYEYPTTPAANSANNNNNDNTTQPETSYTRPSTAPNGSPFPENSGYIEGYPIIEGMGRGKLVIENVRNSSDVFAQLYEKSTAEPLRTFFVGEREQMVLGNLDAGEYFIRYYQLDNGEYLNSESLTLVRNQSATIYLQRGKALHDSL